MAKTLFYSQVHLRVGLLKKRSTVISSLLIFLDYNVLEIEIFVNVIQY